MRTFTIAIATQIVKILKARIIVLADQDTLETDLIADQKRLLLLLLLPLQLRPPPADAEAAAAYGVENWMIMSDQPRISCRRRPLASFFVFLFLIVLLDALCKAFLAIFRSPNEKKRRKTWHSIRIQRPIDGQKCKPVFVPSAGKAPIYNVDLAVKSPAETHFQQICIFHDPQSKLSVRRTDKCYFIWIFALFWNNWSKLFSLKYFCHRNLSPKHVLIAKTAAKTVKERPLGLSL